MRGPPASAPSKPAVRPTTIPGAAATPHGSLRSYSPLGHCGRARSVGFGHRVSIFLHPLAPPALPGFIATTSALTPARPIDLLASRPPCFTQPTFRALCLQPPTRSDGRFITPAFAGAGSNPSAPPASPVAGGPGFTLEPRARQTVRPNRVSHRTDGSFASCCSPPRLATTQLQSATGRSRHTWGRLAPP